MKKLLLFCIAACLSVVASAQRVYFLYLQSDNQVPFYVRLGDKIHSSASSGFLIIPNLTDSTYTFGLGFARNNHPETKFSVTINQDDKGYIIKNFADDMSLFDFRDLSIVKSNSTQSDNTVYETKADQFSSVLSKAANDPGLLRVPVVKKETAAVNKSGEKESVTARVEEAKNSEQVKPIQTAGETPTQTSPETAKSSDTKPVTDILDTVVRQPNIPEATTVVHTTESKADAKPDKKPTVAVSEQESNYQRSLVSRYSESSTTEGFGVVYFDKSMAHTDTIRILIPASKTKLDEDAQTASLSEIEKKEKSNTTATAQVDVQFLPESTVEKPKTDKKVVESEKAAEATNVSSCKDYASDKDFVKLRKKMVGEDTDEAMIDEAKKVFRNKCFTVEQLRYLSTLFMTSAAKYQFFDASYKYASDKQNFTTLKSEIRDEYYLNRFKALVGE